MVNPLPTQGLNFQNVGQKLQELKQLLLNHPVKVFVTLVISRGLWIPLLKNLALYGSAGISAALRILFYPIEFVLSKLPKKCRKGVEIYLQDTLDILLQPLSAAFDLTAASFSWDARDSCGFTSLSKATLVAMANHDEQLFQRDLRSFKQNPAWNLSAYLVIGAPTLYMRILFSAAQKECVHVAHLLATSDDNFNLPANLMVPLLFPGMFMADVLSGIYFVFEAHFLMRSAYLRVEDATSSTRC